MYVRIEDIDIYQIYGFLIIRIHVQVLVDCSGDDRSEKSPEMAFTNKKSALLQLVEGSPVPKTIVFCNKVRWSIYLCGLHW